MPPPEAYERLLRTVQRGRKAFDERVVWNVNSTARGGGSGVQRAVQYNTQGDIAIAANSTESCLDALAVCPDVRNAIGGAVSGNNNNSRTMTWIDADGDPSTFDSSSSDLTLPAGRVCCSRGRITGAG